MGHEKDYSDAVAADIDAEVRALIELAHDEAWEILVEYRDVLDTMVLELIEKETITQDDMNRICERVQKRPPMAPFNGFGKRLPSEAPPVLTPAERDKLKAQAEADGQIAVGGEGQIAVGGIAATAVSLYGGAASLPLPLSFLWPMLAAVLAGGLWGAIAGVLKARVGTNEVISTLLLSFVAVWMVYGAVQSESLLRQPMTNTATLPESQEIPDATKLPLLSADADTPLNAGLPIALLLAAVVAVALDRTVWGLRLRAIGLNPVAARRAGLRIAPTIVLVLFLAGALGGLAGAFMLQGDQGSLKARFSSGYGFDGLVVGLLARGSIAGVVAAALLFGFLRSGGISMEMQAGVPSALVLVIQGVIILLLAGAAFWIDRHKEAER